MKRLTHVDDAGRARMVDVGGKPPQRRTAVARGRIALAAETRRLLAGNELKKGDALAVAQLAGIQAAKKTGELIPLCHPLALDHIEVVCRLTERGVDVESRVSCVGRTGVEMEALTAASVALLTVYDMCKAVDKKMRISDVRLVSKEKSDV
ncbi:MAG TPA: cyclic pyranopterin monophosphate synthase MoaC [Candidatus Brocadiia bacterium]|nr:cyclic pyranopterin monophosphate synthase MoaC [Candidatus Brocadiia bacterium]